MANLNLNKVILGGRVVAQPELKQTQSGVPVCSFSLAVNRRFAKEGATTADFFNATAWKGTAEFISKYFGKGSSICIVGSIQNRTWTDQNGQKRYATDIVVDEAMFVDSKSDAPVAPHSNTAPSTVPPASVVEIDPTDDLPF